MAKLTIKQERFAQAYIETGNASEAYRQAYITSRMKPETINRKAFYMLKQGKIRARVEALTKAIESKAIATAKERQEFWTEMMRDTSEDSKHRLKASEILGKAQGDFIDRLHVSGDDNLENMSTLDLLRKREKLKNSDDNKSIH